MIDTYTLLDLERLNKKLGIRPFEERVFGALDPDREQWEADRARFVTSRGHIIKVPHVKGASFNNPVPSDLVYINKTSYTSKNTFTAEAQVNDTTTNPIPLLQAQFFDQAWGTLKTLRVTVRGQFLTTTTGPTFTLFVRFDSATGTLLAQAGPSTGSVVSLVAATVASGFELEFDVVCRVTGAGTAATFQGEGMLSSPALTPTLIATWGANAPPGTITGDSSVQHQIWVDAACGTSNAANGLTLFQVIVQGLN